MVNIAGKNNHPLAVQVSENMYCAYGPPSASNTVTFTVTATVTLNTSMRKTHMFVLGRIVKALHQMVNRQGKKAICIHQHILYSSLKKSIDHHEPCENDEFVHVPEAEYKELSEDEPISRVSILQLAERQALFQYNLPRSLLQKIMQQDACSMCEIPGGWPERISPSVNNCQLCGGNLRNEVRHSGQRGKVYLISELNSFKSIEVYVKYCQNPMCKAMNRPVLHEIGKLFKSLSDISLFNIAFVKFEC